MNIFKTEMGKGFHYSHLSCLKFSMNPSGVDDGVDRAFQAFIVLRTPGSIVEHLLHCIAVGVLGSVQKSCHFAFCDLEAVTVTCISTPKIYLDG